MILSTLDKLDQATRNAAKNPSINKPSFIKALEEVFPEINHGALFLPAGRR